MEDKVGVDIGVKIQVSKKFIFEKLESGYTKEEIRSLWYPEFNKNQWKKCVEACGLSSKRPKKVTFVITEDMDKEEVVNKKEESVSTITVGTLNKEDKKQQTSGEYSSDIF